jgi:hypothetical protein
MVIKSDFYNNFKGDKIRINRNKNPISMETFLFFLTVPVQESKDHFGSSTGWTLYQNLDLNLSIMGGYVDGIEYLDSIEFGINLQNIYNNYVNPFALFEILTKDGQKFFVDYYKDDIETLLEEQGGQIVKLRFKLDVEKAILKHFESEVFKLKGI